MKKYNIKTTDVELLKKWYYLMTLGRALDEKAPAYLLQSLGWSFHAPYAGHDGIQLAIGQVFTKGEDFLFPYYRDMLTALSAGMTAEELILNGISKATDPGSGGRHMSNHFAKPEWHIENISSATGTHDLHAAGVARAMVYYDHKGVVITSHGESASSEGFVYEAVNGASLFHISQFIFIPVQSIFVRVGMGTDTDTIGMYDYRIPVQQCILTGLSHGRIMGMVYLFRRKTRRQPVKWRITSPDSRI